MPCGSVNGVWPRLDASQAPTVRLNPLKTTQGNEPLKVDTRLSNCLPWWASEKKNTGEKKGKKEEAWLTRQQTTTNHGTGQRSNVTVRKGNLVVMYSVNTENPLNGS